MSNKKFGECRCCLAKGKHKDITKEYYRNGHREVFIDSFMECFNLFLSTHKQLTTLICTECVSRLREACRFRSLVAKTERKLLEAVSDQGQTVFVNVPVDETEECDIKLEQLSEIKDEPQESGDEMDFGEHIDDDYDTDVDIKDDLVDGEAELLARFNSDVIDPLPTRHTLRHICPNYARHLDLLKGITVFPRTLRKLLKENDNRQPMISGNVYITEKVGQVINATTLLKHSNMTPFKSRGRKGFLCFYCPNIFENATKLREHTIEHDKGLINGILKTYVTESLVINVDVKDLACTICCQLIKTMNDLKSHLVGVHKMKLYTQFTDRMVPFELDEKMFVCQTCGCNFETFGAIERHMNIHYRNYICKECGTGFVTKARLKVHFGNTHVGGAFPCEICGKMFATQLRLKNHINAVHKMVKRFRCNKCPERFTEYVYRQKHLEDVHGVPSIKYKCNVCEKSFSRRYNLSMHMKRDHLEEKNYQCDLCPYTCFSNKQLSMHMVKHNGEKIFECSVCKKSYARKKTLSEHMKIHNNDRRFACAVCGQAFVQKCSLKGHMKTHHLEYSLT